MVRREGIGMNKEIVNIGHGSKVETWRDGEWQILYAESAGSKTTLSLRDHDAWRLAHAMCPSISQYHERARKAGDAVCEMSYPAVRAEQLREIANEIDCGGGCENCSPSRIERGEFCGFIAAEDMRKLATALDLKARIEIERTKRWVRVRWGMYRIVNLFSPRLAIRILRPEQIPF